VERAEADVWAYQRAKGLSFSSVFIAVCGVLARDLATHAVMLTPSTRARLGDASAFGVRRTARVPWQG
jgi:hypothetical protein